MPCLRSSSGALRNVSLLQNALQFVPVKRRRREVETEKTEQSADKEADERGDKESQPLASVGEMGFLVLV